MINIKKSIVSKIVLDSRNMSIQEIDTYTCKYHNKELQTHMEMETGIIWLKGNSEIEQEGHEKFIRFDDDLDEPVPPGEYLSRIVGYRLEFTNAPEIELYFKTSSGHGFAKCIYGFLHKDTDLERIISLTNKGGIPKHFTSFNDLILGKHLYVKVRKNEPRFSSIKSVEILLNQLDQDKMKKMYEIFKTDDDVFEKLNAEYNDENIDDMQWFESKGYDARYFKTRENHPDFFL